MTNGAERTRWKIRSDRLVDETPQVRLSIASLELASGLTFEQYVMRLPRCAMTVVLDEPAERILLIWRHRFIIDRWMWELPGGYIDPGEDGITAAAREVEEETGYRPRSIEPILTFQPMTGSADSAHELYLARGADRVGAPLADEAEEVRWIPLADLPGLIATGQILGAATIIGAQHALLAAEGASRTVPSMAHESVTARDALGTTPGMRKGHSQTRERPLSRWPDLSAVWPGWIGTRRRRATHDDIAGSVPPGYGPDQPASYFRGVVVLLTAGAQQRGSKLGPAVADLVAVAGGGDQARVAEREQVARDASRAEPSHRGERGRREGLVQGRQDNGAGAAKQPPECARRRGGCLPKPGDAGGGVDDRGQPRFLDDRRDVRPQVGARHEQQSALTDRDSAAIAVGQRQAPLRPADLRVEVIQDAPQAVLGQQAGAFVDIAIEQGADAMPKRRDQAGPGLMEAGCELVACAFGVGEQRRDQAAIVLVGYGFPAPGKLT